MQTKQSLTVLKFESLQIFSRHILSDPFIHNFILFHCDVSLPSSNFTCNKHDLFIRHPNHQNRILNCDRTKGENSMHEEHTFVPLGRRKRFHTWTEKGSDVEVDNAIAMRVGVIDKVVILHAVKSGVTSDHCRFVLWYRSLQKVRHLFYFLYRILDEETNFQNCIQIKNCSSHAFWRCS